MQWYNICYIVAFACLTLTLILLKVFKIGSRRRGVVKMLTSAMFVAGGIFGAVVHGGLTILAAVALFFAALGDLFLVFKDNRPLFIVGILSFAIASICLCTFSVLQFGWIWWSAIPFALFIVGNVLCQKFGVYSYGSLIVYLNVYSVAVGACGTMGLALLCVGGAGVASLLFGLGCLMYFISDVFLGLYMFRFRNRIVDAINTALYFPGMLLVAIAIILI